MITNIRPQTRYIPVADTAKLIRADLKREFPGVKFSVRSSSYAGGASVDVSWTDGPTTKAVERVAKRYQGASFDGMIDLKTTHDSILNGETVRYGADYVFCQRDTTRQLLEQVIAEAHRRYGLVVTINGYGGFECAAGYDEERPFRILLSDAYCDNTGRVVAYVEVK